VALEVTRDTAALEAALGPVRVAGGGIALVPTMGALHEGHLALVRRAAELAPVVVVTVFVNPTQFDVAADLDAYPRDLAGDLAALAPLVEGDDAPTLLVVHAPSVADVYPDGPGITRRAGAVGTHLCGATRPGHFDGVATVVDRLLALVRPTVAVFGRKDFQQVAVVRALVAEAGHPVRIEAAPTVREHDAVARSSRNLLLDPEGRRLAGRIPRALAAAVDVARAARADGAALDPDAVRTALRSALGAEGLEVVYAEAADPTTIVPLDAPVASDATVLAAVAVTVPGRGMRVRLIDNVVLGDVADEERLLAAVALASPAAGTAAQ
jgi:pantoate--beta-alanine ligase